VSSVACVAISYETSGDKAFFPACTPRIVCNSSLCNAFLVDTHERQP
jgi:hypothetical protein